MSKRKEKNTKYVFRATTICPKCEQESEVISLDYRMNKNGDGTLFTYQCQTCNEKFDIERKFRDF